MASVEQGEGRTHGSKKGCPGASASDKVPFQSAGVVFTLDTRTETMLLHDMAGLAPAEGRTAATA